MKKFMDYNASKLAYDAANILLQAIQKAGFKPGSKAEVIDLGGGCLVIRQPAENETATEAEAARQQALASFRRLGL